MINILLSGAAVPFENEKTLAPQGFFEAYNISFFSGGNHNIP